MTSENACYQFLLLKHGFYNQYNKWFDTLLEEENPLSAETLGLIDCSNDYDKITAYLANIAIDGYDRAAVCEKIRLFLCEEFNSGRVVGKECTHIMYEMSLHDMNYENCGEWWPMFNLDDYYDLAETGIVKMSDFEQALSVYLNTGVYNKYQFGEV